MLNKDSLFQRSNDAFFRAGRPVPPAQPAEPAASPQPAAAAHTAVAHSAVAAHAAAPGAKGEERKEAKLIVGPDIKMKGVEVSDCDTLVVEGRIEATLDARLMQVAQSGTFSGTVAVDIAEIHGRVEGDLTVRKQLVLHATGKVSGKIRYARIKVEEGAELSGEISVLDRAPASSSHARSAPAVLRAPIAAESIAPPKPAAA